MKKERQERAKAIEEERAKTEEVVKPAVEEPAQEAIITRKKKAKKEKEPKVKAKSKASTSTTTATATPSAAESTPNVSQPSSPVTKPVSESVPIRESPQALDNPPKPPTPSKAVSAPAQPSLPSPSELSPPLTPTLTAAQLVAELKASAPELQKCIDSLFRITNSTNLKPSSNISAKEITNPTSWRSEFKVNLTKDEVDALLKGKVPAVHYGGDEGRN